MKKLTQFLIISTIIILLDRITKNIVLENLTNIVVLIPNLLSLRLVYNNGVAFGLFSGFPYVIEVFTGFIILASLYVLPRIPKNYIIPMGVLIGGAAGNFIDRIIYNHGVIDFISVRLFSVFNFADIAVSAGVVWIIIIMFIEDNREKKLYNEQKTKKRKTPETKA